MSNSLKNLGASNLSDRERADIIYKINVKQDE